MRFLVTGAWKYTQDQLDAIAGLGHTVVEMDDERGALPCEYASVDGVICNGLFLYHPIEKFPSLKYIQLTSAGFDRVPMDHIRERGIQIHNARGVYSIPMAELAVCGVLQLYKQSRFFAANQAARRWEKHRGLLELSGKNVCIIGCGDVAVECAKRFSAFDCRVTGVNIRPKELPYFEKIVLLEQLEEVLPQADVVVLAVPLAPETERLMNAARFALMKPGAILVNIARGPVVDTQAMIDALERKLGGAVLDVFEEEPLRPDSPLWQMENVIITPHNSFIGDNTQHRLWRVIENNLKMG